MFKRIVLAYDGTDHARKAYDAAVEIAVKFGSSLDILHVVTGEHASDEVAEFARVEHAGDPDQVELTAGTAGTLGPIAKRARAKGIKEVNTIPMRGDPADEVVGYVKSSGADLVVLGRRGLGRLGGIIHGSVSAQIEGETDCAVLTVK
jgi:nucleotide-binding universal stress UspA family protein